ncbi:MAG: hypothetical protein ACREAB_01200 [Blastocatellia bacterium]
MGRLKQFFSDMFAMFFMGVGISTTRTKQRKLDLRKMVSGAGEGPGERWILVNCAASSVEYKGKQAVRLDARRGAGLAWIEGLRFSVGKLDLDIAAVEQDASIAFHVQNEREFEALCFHIGDEARSEDEIQSVAVRYVSTGSAQDMDHEARFDIPYSKSGEWFKARISISKEVIAVFIDGGNVPCLRVDNSSGGEVYGSVGLWVGAGSSALVADFRIHEVRSDVENQVRRIFGKRASGSAF